MSVSWVVLLWNEVATYTQSIMRSMEEKAGLFLQYHSHQHRCHSDNQQNAEGGVYMKTFSRFRCFHQSRCTYFIVCQWVPKWSLFFLQNHNESETTAKIKAFISLSCVTLHQLSVVTLFNLMLLPPLFASSTSIKIPASFSTSTGKRENVNLLINSFTTARITRVVQYPSYCAV